jgi:hypothetical protein
MELQRVVTGRDHGVEVAALAASRDVVVRCSDADTVLAAASWREALVGDIGVWLVVGEDYPTQLAARDVKTLAALVPLRRVVIQAASLVDEHAEVLAALLTNDEVNFANEVATLRGAYNRPAPPRSIDLWRYREGQLVMGDQTLGVSRSETLEWGELTYFA